MEGKIAKTQVVLVKLDCSDGKTRSFSCPVNVNLDRVDGMYVSQVSAATNDDTDPGTIYSIYSDLVNGPISLMDSASTTPNTYFKFPSGQTVRGNYTFRIEDVASAATTMHYVVGILLTFVKL